VIEVRTGRGRLASGVSIDRGRDAGRLSSAARVLPTMTGIRPSGGGRGARRYRPALGRARPGAEPTEACRAWRRRPRCERQESPSTSGRRARATSVRAMAVPSLATGPCRLLRAWPPGVAVGARTDEDAAKNARCWSDAPLNGDPAGPSAPSEHVRRPPSAGGGWPADGARFRAGGAVEPDRGGPV